MGTKITKIREQKSRNKNPGTKFEKIQEQNLEQKFQKIWEQKLQKSGNKKYKIWELKL
jgi:hypothetical protein